MRLGNGIWQGLMLTNKQVKGLRRWSCTGCGTGLGYVGEGFLILRERSGKVQLDVKGAVSIVRLCSNCGTENELNQVAKYKSK